MCLVIPLKVSEPVRINFNKFELIAVCLPFLRNKGTPQYLAVVVKVLTADGAVVLHMPQATACSGLGRTFPQSLSGRTTQRDAPTTKAWVDTAQPGEVSKMNSKYGIISYFYELV